ILVPEGKHPCAGGSHELPCSERAAIVNHADEQRSRRLNTPLRPVDKRADLLRLQRQRERKPGEKSIPDFQRRFLQDGILHRSQGYERRLSIGRAKLDPTGMGLAHGIEEGLFDVLRRELLEFSKKEQPGISLRGLERPEL